MDARKIGLIAALGSALLIAGAWMFQFMGYPPCKMCHWQRWPHYVAMGLGVLIFIKPREIYFLLGATAAFVTSGIGFFHTGVEKGWWEGPSSCTGSGSLSGLSGADLLATDGDFLVMCDQVSWAFMGISMASWNGLFSAGLVLMWIAAAKRA